MDSSPVWLFDSVSALLMFCSAAIKKSSTNSYSKVTKQMTQMQIQDGELASAQFIEEHRWPTNSNGVEHSE